MRRADEMQSSGRESAGGRTCAHGDDGHFDVGDGEGEGAGGGLAGHHAGEALASNDVAEGGVNTSVAKRVKS